MLCHSRVCNQLYTKEQHLTTDNIKSVSGAETLTSILNSINYRINNLPTYSFKEPIYLDLDNKYTIKFNQTLKVENNSLSVNLSSTPYNNISILQQGWTFDNKICKR